MIIREVVDEQGNVLREEVVEEKSKYMKISAAAAYFDVTPHTIHDWAKKGKIRKYRIEGFQNVRVLREEIENLFKPDTEAFDNRA